MKGLHMLGRILMTFLCVFVMTIEIVCASPFIEDGVVPKKEPKSSVVAPRQHLLSLPLPRMLPPLPRQEGLSQGGVTEPPKKRWTFVGRIDDRIFVIDAQTGQMQSFSEGEALTGGCIATNSGVICGKDAQEWKKKLPADNRKSSESGKLDNLMFSAQDVAQQCVQFDSALRSEHSTAVKALENEIEGLRSELEIRKNAQNQVLAQQLILQEQLALAQRTLSKVQSENKKIKDETAFLFNTIALLEKRKNSKYSMPGFEGRVFRGPGGSAMTLTIKDDEVVARMQPVTQIVPEESTTPIDMKVRRDK